MNTSIKNINKTVAKLLDIIIEETFKSFAVTKITISESIPIVYIPNTTKIFFPNGALYNSEIKKKGMTLVNIFIKEL
jgi:hypothetical protein